MKIIEKNCAVMSGMRVIRRAESIWDAAVIAHSMCRNTHNPYSVCVVHAWPAIRAFIDFKLEGKVVETKLYYYSRNRK